METPRVNLPARSELTAQGMTPTSGVTHGPHLQLRATLRVTGRCGSCDPSARESPMSEKPTILIADDEPSVVAALAREARRAGLSYITDTTSQQVLELAVRHQPAVIILDLKQHVDGRDILAALKRDPRT